jgi:hypothetical protein
MKGPPHPATLEWEWYGGRIAANGQGLLAALANRNGMFVPAFGWFKLPAAAASALHVW